MCHQKLIYNSHYFQYLLYNNESMTAPSGPVVECAPCVQEVVGSFPGWVIPKTLKMLFKASLLSTLHLMVRLRIYSLFPHF